MGTEVERTERLAVALENALLEIHQLERTVMAYKESNQVLLFDRMYALLTMYAVIVFSMYMFLLLAVASFHLALLPNCFFSQCVAFGAQCGCKKRHSTRAITK